MKLTDADVLDELADWFTVVEQWPVGGEESGRPIR